MKTTTTMTLSAMAEAVAKDPPPVAIDMNQLLNEATELANGTAAANARTATTRTVVDKKTAFLEQITNVTTKFARNSTEWKDKAAEVLTAVTPKDAEWYNANKDTVTENFMDALAHLGRDEVTKNYVEKDAGVILGIIPPPQGKCPNFAQE